MLGRELGSGGYGNVFYAEHKKTETPRAIKVIEKKNIQQHESLINEFRLLKEMDHPSIIKLYEIYESENYLYMVVEYCEGGELFDFITTRGYLMEREAAIIMRQMVSAVAYCHVNKIIHRDLKPENFLLHRKNDLTSIKLIDFGLSYKYKENEVLNIPNGTVSLSNKKLALLYCT